MQIALFNVHYSANLGDGLLSHCLRSEIEKNHSDVHVKIYDLAGRTAFGEGAKRRKRAIAVLDRLPDSVRMKIIAIFLGREVRARLRPCWAEGLAAADAAILGGGNLFIDVDLNFPLKIAGLGAELRESGKSWVVYGVGVSSDWSPLGRKLFESAFTRNSPLSVTVRDAYSKQWWDQMLSSKVGVPEAAVCADPAVLACDHFSWTPSRRAEHRILGLNIMAPSEINLHTDHGVSSNDVLMDWWIELINRAVKHGYIVKLFTNGLVQDALYLDALWARLRGTEVPLDRLVAPETPTNPHELANAVAGCDVLAGHRMHMHVPAFSFQRPSVGFRWDKKVESFFNSVDRGEFMLDANENTPSEAVECIARADALGVDAHVWRRVTQLARRQIAQMVEVLRAGTDPSLYSERAARIS